MREPTAAGTYYQRDPTLLKEEIEACYNGVRGPGALPLSKLEQNARAIVVPNSPYPHCGQCMAWAYKAIAETATPDVYIIIAGNHHSEEDGVSVATFNSPLGFVRVDQDLAKHIVEKGTIALNESIHTTDHGIEVQLPFLLHAKAKDIERVKILPIMVSVDTDLKRLALDIKESIIELKRNVIFICSTDLTHYGPIFHYVPFTSDIPGKIYDIDKQVIELIKAHDPDGMRAYLESQFIRNMRSIELMLRATKPLLAKLEMHYTSGDILADYKNSVSYAAIVFEEKEK